MTYTYVWDHTRNQVHDFIIQRDEDGAFIPFDPDNRDYQEYLEWTRAGNVAKLAPGMTPDPPPSTLPADSKPRKGGLTGI